MISDSVHLIIGWHVLRAVLYGCAGVLAVYTVASWIKEWVRR